MTPSRVVQDQVPGQSVHGHFKRRAPDALQCSI